MSRRFWMMLAFVSAASFSAALANDEIYLKKGGKVKNVITAESAKGITVKSGEKYSADDIDDIYYDVGSANATVQANYSNGFKAERDYLDTTKDAKKRAVAYASAMEKYQKMTAEVAAPRVRTHFDYKIGFLHARKALEENLDTKNAIASLSLFVSKNPQSWQIARALTLLAKLQLDAKDFTAAEKSYADLAKLDVSDDVKYDAQLQSALANIQLGKHLLAEPKLDALLKVLPKGSKHAPRALVAQAECFLKAQKTKEGMDILKKITTDPDPAARSLKAVAYNTLGVSLYEEKKLKEARWEFLWVDVVYNQDKNEHARAVYYLMKIFEELAETDRATECRDLLLRDKTFVGTEHQRKLMKETGK